MRIQKEEDKIFFSTGKSIYAHNGVVGISPRDEIEGWNISEGHDGGIDYESLTKDECIELADFMINLWERFRYSQKVEEIK